MTTYFILTKEDILHNEKDQIININKDLTFILPRNILNYYADYGLFENTLIDWCKTIIGNGVFLDVGAHTGTYSISLADYCTHVYSFEPQKMTYYALCGSVALSNKKNITCYNTGLGNSQQVGKQQLKIISKDGGGSSLHIKNPLKILSEETIEIQTLDYYNIQNVTFIKIDVEENELYVLQGALKTLNTKPKILFESNNTNENLFKYLTDIGYKIVNITRYCNMYLAD